MRLFLASRSPARRRMLEAAGVVFDIRTGAGDEEEAKARFRRHGLGPPDLALALAEFKAFDAGAETGALTLGADQTLECEDGTSLDKPGSREEAAEQLRILSGRTHKLHSAAVVIEEGRAVWGDTQSVALSVRPLGEEFIGAYLDREYEAVRHNVGGYRIEGLGVQLFDRIEGSHFAILGLPLLPLLGYLRERGVLPS